VSHIYRCTSCRTRNTWPKPLAAYVRGRKCRHCGHGRFYVDKERLNRKPCNCMAYHHPHRPNSGACGSFVDTLGFLVKRAVVCPF
jgi:hypothetical protein